jgi:hypothetical protein
MSGCRTCGFRDFSVYDDPSLTVETLAPRISAWLAGMPQAEPGVAPAVVLAARCSGCGGAMILEVGLAMRAGTPEVVTHLEALQ